MSKAQRKYFWFSSVVIALGLVALQQTDGNAAGVMGIMRAKTLPAETVAVLNPEGGSSTGTTGSEVNLAAGDIILFRFEWTPAPQNIAWGINHYLTEYLPDNLEAVGVRILDKNTLKVVKPHYPGRTLDGCATCSDTEVNCDDAEDVDESCTVSTGSIAQLYGDTGIFYSEYADEANLRRSPLDAFLELTSGNSDLLHDTTDDTPTFVFPTFSTALGFPTSGGPYYSHNYWDFINVLVFGTKGGNQSISGGSGGGAPPHGYGSPVAGTGSGYTLTPVEGDGEIGGVVKDPLTEDIEFNGTTGPWKRIVYPGSLLADFGTPSGTNDLRTITDASDDGYDLVPANSLASGATIRAALGGVPLGQEVIVEIAARVDSDFKEATPWIDPDQMANVNCGEIFGGDGGRDVGTENNMWSLFAPLAQCVILRAQVDIETDTPLCESSGDLVTFSVKVKNLAVLTDEDVVVRLQCSQGTSCTSGMTLGLPVGVTEVAADPDCDVMDSASSCRVLNLGDLASFEEVEFTVQSDECEPGAELLTLRVNYTSGGNTADPDTLGPLGDPGFTTTEVTQTRTIGVPELTVSWDETNDPKYVADLDVSAQTTPVSGTLGNNGTDSMDYDGLQFNLPSGWTIDGGSISVTDSVGGGHTETCAAAPEGDLTYDEYFCDFGSGHSIVVGGADITFSFDLSIPMSTAAGNYPIHVEPYVGFGSFFKSASWVAQDAITVTVQEPRTDAPELDCPIVSSAGSTISGTLAGEPSGSTVYLWINKILRGETTTDGSGNWSIDVDKDCPFPLSAGEYCFGELYAGLEIVATAENTSDGETESLESEECEGGVRATKQCSDGIDNDGDGFIDFPADLGCTGPGDNDESDDADAPLCSNAISDGDGDTDIDFGADMQCFGPDDNLETGGGECSDGIDNDGDGLIDTNGENNDGVLLDPSCAKNAVAGFVSERDYALCQNVVDDADTDPSDPLADFTPTRRNPVAAVSTGSETVTVAGDITAELGTDDRFLLRDSTGNNGYYTVVSAVFGGVNTVITVSEDIDSSTADGFIEYKGIGDPGCHTAFDDDEGDVGAGPPLIRPRILLVFDTSGSMNSHVCALPPPSDESSDFVGDGSFECLAQSLDVAEAVCDAGGTHDNTFKDDSRLFKVKEGISDVVASFGEADYALMRFKQQPRDFGCFDGFGSGGWQGGGTAGAADYPEACQPFNEGELVVDFSPDNTSSLLKWMDHDSNYGEMNEGAGADVDTLSAPYGLDWELRGSGSTPLAGALESARKAIYAQIQEDIDNDDPAADCRPYRVIVVTDGLESCAGTPEDVAGDLWDQTGETLPGGGTPPRVPVRVIGFSSGNPALEAGLEAIANAGARKADGTTPENAIIVSNEADLSNAMAAIISDAIVVEYCDGEDNDCDTLIDEGYGIYEEDESTIDFDDETLDRDYADTTNLLLGNCERPATWRCAVGATPLNQNTDVVRCATADDADLDTEETWEANICLVEVEYPTPITEDCGFGDEDCDGKIDESGAGDVPPPDPLLVCSCSTEICDGEDNDCDDEIDEDTEEDPLPGVGQDCGTDVGACEAGEYYCDGDNGLVCDAPTDYPQDENNLAEHCNEIDDDCDGAIDEVAEVCFTGTIDDAIGCPADITLPCEGECRRGVNSCLDVGVVGDPPRNTGCLGQVTDDDEICDGLDNDCDGSIDEDFTYTDPDPPNGELDIGVDCFNDLLGLCRQPGTVVCNATQDGAICETPTVLPTPEICDGDDNDCDGEIDEVWDGIGDPSDGVGAPVGEECNAGTCGTGEFICQNGVVVCDGGGVAEPEICDGIDNNCVGGIDETFPEDGDKCEPGDLDVDEIANPPVGECKYGDTVCVGGDLSCANYKGPTDEICDGLDNDCDGEIDDAAPCEEGEVCLGGSCVAPCEEGEFPCGFGFYCGLVEGQTDGFCLPDPCVNLDCGEGFFCESSTGDCVDLCGGVTCPDDAICQDGFCLDCFILPCEEGQNCVSNGAGVGVCEDDACFGVSCDEDAGEFCLEGTCTTVGCEGGCASDERCLNGECVGSACKGVNCPNGRVCRPDTGECVFNDQCDTISCLNGEACHPGTGECISNPCIGVDCPEGFGCNISFAGEAYCGLPPGEFIFAGGGGCQVGEQSRNTSWMLLLLGALGWMGRRRRQIASRSR